MAHSFPVSKDLESQERKIHIPVMLEDVLSFLNPRENALYVDATFGCGGYSEALLTRNCRVVAMDRDPSVLPRTQELKEKYKERFTFILGNFSQMQALLAEKGITAVDGIVFDLGVSSPQLDEAHRGFSFQKEGPLDMRMAQEGMSAFDVVNTASEETLADIFYYYGDEVKSRRVARAIIKARCEKPLETTRDLVDVVHSVLGKKQGKIDAATRVFQALRIHVNDELGSLKKGLEQALSILSPKSPLVVVAFHSLEDRLVKTFFQKKGISQENSSPQLMLLTRKVKCASEAEICLNPRARSAKLRAALKAFVLLFLKIGGL